MDDTPFGLIELVLVLGAILGWAGWEVLRNRRELAKLRHGNTGGAPPD